MATVYYTGLAPVTRQLERITVSTVAASATYKATIIAVVAAGEQ